MLKNKIICITGGTGSLGKAIVNFLISKHPELKEIRVLSRDEQKHFVMQNEIGIRQSPCIKFILGDVRDLMSLRMAFEGVDYVIHAAANKHVHIAELNPFECVKTNIDGAKNVILASKQENVSRVVALSTDKACSPINLYGATKLVSDKLFIAASSSQEKGPIFSVVRYGNVLGSNGSVVPFFWGLKDKNVLPITDLNMTRFNITIDEAVNMVFYSLYNSIGGELYIPKLPSYKITDLAKAIAPNAQFDLVGLRPGEKINEEMISSSDSNYTYEIKDYYVIIPSINNAKILELLKSNNAKKVPVGFRYSSEINSFLTIEQIRTMIKKHLDFNI